MVNEKGIDKYNLFLLLKLFKMQERYKNVVKKNEVRTLLEDPPFPLYVFVRFWAILRPPPSVRTF